MMGISFPRSAQACAGLIAVMAWVGLMVQFHVSSVEDGPPLATAWAMARYFTIQTNLALAIVFTGVALGRPGFGSASLLGGITLAILLVGVVFSLLLAGASHLAGIERLSNFLMHYATPTLTPLFWLAFAPKGRLRRRDPLVWAVFPLAYLAYVLLRGAVDGRYPYGFLNVALIGWAQVGVNATVIAAGFMAVAYGLVGLDGLLGQQSGRSDPAADTGQAVPVPNRVR